jgi:hypothetical protein
MSEFMIIKTPKPPLTIENRAHVDTNISDQKDL